MELVSETCGSGRLEPGSWSDVSTVHFITKHYKQVNKHLPRCVFHDAALYSGRGNGAGPGLKVVLSTTEPHVRLSRQKSHP